MTEEYVLITDISQWQGDVNFEAMKAQGVKGVFIRCTVGIHYEDPRFKEYWKAAGEAGLKRGAYMVVVPGQVGQVAFFRMVMGDRAGEADFPHVIDLEITRRRLFKLGEWVTVPYLKSTINNTFMQTYNEFLSWSGHPIVYTNANTAFIMGSPAFIQKVRRRWVAHYTTRSEPLLPAGWPDFHIWQHSADNNNQGPLYGGSADSMDLNRMTVDFYNQFAGEGVPPTEPIEPTEPLTLESIDDRLLVVEGLLNI